MHNNRHSGRGVRSGRDAPTTSLRLVEDGLQNQQAAAQTIAGNDESNHTLARAWSQASVGVCLRLSVRTSRHLYKGMRSVETRRYSDLTGGHRPIFSLGAAGTPGANVLGTA